MTKLRFWIIGALVPIIAAACTADQALTDQVQAQATELANLSVRLDELVGTQAEIEATLDEIQSHEQQEESSATPSQIVLAQYILDTAGFHDMEEALTGGEPIEPEFLSTVLRTQKIVSNTDWPEELIDPVEALAHALEEFLTAMEADDLENAAPASSEAHDAEHELSEAIDAWLGAEAGEHGHSQGDALLVAEIVALAHSFPQVLTHWVSIDR